MATKKKSAMNALIAAEKNYNQQQYRSDQIKQVQQQLSKPVAKVTGNTAWDRLQNAQAQYEAQKKAPTKADRQNLANYVRSGASAGAAYANKPIMQADQSVKTPATDYVSKVMQKRLEAMDRQTARDAMSYGKHVTEEQLKDPAYMLATQHSAEDLEKMLAQAQGAAKSAKQNFEYRQKNEQIGLYNNSPENAAAAQGRYDAALKARNDRDAEVENLQDALAMRKRMDAQEKRGAYEQQILASRDFSDDLAQRGLHYIRNRINESRKKYEGKYDVPESALYQDYMTEDEKRVFGYLTAMDMHDAQFPASGVHYEEWKPGSKSWYNGMYAGGRSAAYIKSIHDELIDRIYDKKARERFVPSKGAGLAEIGKKVLDYTAASLNEGIGRGVEGLVNAFNPNYKGYDTPQQRLLGYAQAANERDYGDTLRGRLYRDLGGAAQSIGQMLPAMAAGYGAGALVGTLGTGVAGTGALSATNVGSTAAMASTAAQRAAFFLSIKGNAYAEARAQGMTEAQAQTYSMINALSETSLESLIGGIAGFGGISEQELGIRANQIRNTFGRIAAHTALNYAGELVEENLQDIIDPIVLSMITGKQHDLPTLSDLLDTSIATIMMVSGTNAVETGKYAYQTRVRNNLLKIADQAQELGKNDAAYQRLADNVRNFVDEVDRNPDTMKFTKQDTLAALSWKTWLDLSKAVTGAEAGDTSSAAAAAPSPQGEGGGEQIGEKPEARQNAETEERIATTGDAGLAMTEQDRFADNGRDAEGGGPYEETERDASAVQKSVPYENERSLNNGTEISGDEQRAAQEAGAAAAEAETQGTENREARVALSDGGRDLGQREGAVGISSDVRIQGRSKQQRQVADQRAAAASNTPLRSSADFIRNGTDAELLHELPEDSWDDEVKASVDYAKKNGASRVTVVTGLLEVASGDGVAHPAAAVNLDTGEIVVRGDSMQQSVSESVMHEVGHLNATTVIVRAFAAAVQQNVSPLAWQTIFTAYEKKYAALTGNYAGMTAQEKNDYIWEEILCDANAGLDKFGVRGADLQKYAKQAFTVSGSDTAGASARTGIKFESEKSQNTDQVNSQDSYENVDLSEDSYVYNYDFLTSQKPMNVVLLPEVPQIQNSNKKVDRSTVIQLGMKNARSAGAERAGNIVIVNRYSGRELRVDVETLRHSLNGKINRLLTNARLASVVGDVIYNAIPINALHNTASDINGTYAMAGYATDSKGREFVAIITVEERSNNIIGIESVDVAHSVSGRQKNGSQASTKLQGIYPIKTTDITINDFLEIVNSTYQSILSDDVLKHFGETRNPKGEYSNKVKFSAEDAEDDDFGNGLGVNPEFRANKKTGERIATPGARTGLAMTGKEGATDNGLGVTGPGFAETEDISSALRAPSPQGEGMGNGLGVNPIFRDVPEYRPGMNREKQDNGLGVTGPGFAEPQGAGGIDRRTAQTLRQRRQAREAGIGGPGPQTERSAALAQQGLPNAAETQQGAPVVTDEYGTEALRDLGVKVDSSVGSFYAVKQLLEANRAAKSVRKELSKAEKRLNATAKEKDFASGVAAGIYGMDDLPKTVDADRVMELADYYMAERAVKGNLIRQRKRSIKRELDQQMLDLFKDADQGKDGKPFAPARKQAMVVLNNRTPARNMRTIFGDKNGEKIYQEIFAPVEKNEAERYRFINRMYDKVRTFTDSNGKQTKLTKEERAIAQMLLEGKGIGQIVAAGEMADVIKKAAKEIADGKKADDALFGLGLDKQDRETTIRLSGWLQAQEALKGKKVDSVRVNNAVKEYEKIYGQMYEAINDFLAAHGIEPIGFIPSYAPHIQPEEVKNAMQSAFSLLGLNAEVSSLPTSIAGLTADFKPDKRWNPHFLERTGDRTEYDIAKGFEHYVDYISDIFYHTDDVMRVRAASRYFRQTYAPEEIKNNLDAAKGLQYMSVAEQANFLREKGVISRDSAPSASDVQNMMEDYIDKLYEDITKTSAHGNLVMWLDNYANILAGKQTVADRGWEYSVGRKGLNIGNKLTKIFGQSKIAGNLSSMLNQGAQLPMIYGELGARWTTAALRDIATGKLRRAAWAQESNFLTGKKGVDGLVTDVKDMILDTMFKPAEFMDTLVSTIAVRGKYLEQIHNGASHEEAMRAADKFGSEVMGSRMKGTRPLAYNAKNPLSAMTHIFQVEAVNSWEHLVKDLPRDFRQIQKEHGTKKAAAALSGVIVKMLLAAFVLNRLDDEIYSGTPAPFDILGLSANFIASGEGLTTNDWIRTIIDNGLEKLGAERLFGTDANAISDEDFNWEQALEDTGYNVSNDVPFVRNISSLLGLGDKSLPMPDVYGGIKGVVDAVANNGMSPETGKALLKLLTELLPGGNQINKTTQGIETVARGGDYTGYGEGKQIKYPTDEGVLKAAQAILFGKNATNANEAYYAAGANKLSAKQTALYEDFVSEGLSRRDAYKIITDTRKRYQQINKEDAKASQKATMLASWINAQQYTEDQKARLRDTFKYYSNIPAEAEAYDKLLDQGVSDADATALVSAFGQLTPEEGKEQVSAVQKYRAIVDAGMNEQNQMRALAATMTDAEYEKLETGYDNGITPTMYVSFRETMPKYDEDGNGSYTQDEVKAAINSMRGLSKQQKAVLWQLANKSWKYDNNPFDQATGRKVYNAMH